MPVSGVVELGAWRSIEATYPSLPVSPDPRFPASVQRAYLVRGSHAEPLGVSDGDVLLAVADAGWRDGDVVIARRTRADGFEQELSAVRACSDLSADAEVLARVICAYKVF